MVVDQLKASEEVILAVLFTVVISRKWLRDVELRACLPRFEMMLCRSLHKSVPGPAQLLAAFAAHVLAIPYDLKAFGAYCGHLSNVLLPFQFSLIQPILKCDAFL